MCIIVWRQRVCLWTFFAQNIYQWNSQCSKRYFWKFWCSCVKPPLSNNGLTDLTFSHELLSIWILFQERSSCLHARRPLLNLLFPFGLPPALSLFSVQVMGVPWCKRSNERFRLLIADEWLLKVENNDSSTFLFNWKKLICYFLYWMYYLIQPILYLGNTHLLLYISFDQVMRHGTVFLSLPLLHRYIIKKDKLLVTKQNNRVM